MSSITKNKVCVPLIVKRSPYCGRSESDCYNQPTLLINGFLVIDRVKLACCRFLNGQLIFMLSPSFLKFRSTVSSARRTVLKRWLCNRFWLGQNLATVEQKSYFHTKNIQRGTGPLYFGVEQSRNGSKKRLWNVVPVPSQYRSENSRTNSRPALRKQSGTSTKKNYKITQTN